MFLKPCIECGVLSKGTRCERHQNIINAKINAKKTQRIHYKGDYRARAKAVRENATHCWLCGEAARLDDPFEADHVIPADPFSPLLPAHRSCNGKRGNREA